jgi:predicted dehydrogenase
MTASRLNRRAALKRFGAALTVPFVFRLHAGAAPSATLNHASFGANGQAWSDIQSLTQSRHLRLVAVAEVDLARAAEVRQRFPQARVYQDWRQLLDRERDLNSANVSTPDHMHAPITMRLLQRGVHVYTQKPLTQTLYEAHQLARVAADRRLVTQMGIQIHSVEIHRMVVRLIQDGAVGRVREVHSWSNKRWGDRGPRPERRDPVPAPLNWNGWLGVAAERPFIRGYYHPSEWRRRLDFGTGTFGDMGCHILDPVFTSLALTAPRSVRADSGAPNADSWGLDAHVCYVFPGTAHTTETLTLNWYDGGSRPPDAVRQLLGGRGLSDQGSIYLGANGVLYSPYIDTPVLLPQDRFRDYRMPRPGSEDHYLQFVEACRGRGRTSTPFSYSGPLTEAVLLGCLATRFVDRTLEWNAADLRVTNVNEANRFVRKQYRRGWEVEGLS